MDKMAGISLANWMTISLVRLGATVRNLAGQLDDHKSGDMGGDRPIDCSGKIDKMGGLACGEETGSHTFHYTLYIDISQHIL
jgi:hypothetical protein